MKRLAIFAASAIATLGLTACSPGFYGSAGYGVTLHNGDVVTHAPGQPDAAVSADGSLRIGTQDIALTPAQRASLKTYYEASQAIVADGKATGKAGEQLGLSVGGLVKNIFAGNASSAGKAMSTRADAVTAAAQKLCTDIRQVQRTQHAIAAQLPVFKPYADADTAHCKVTETTTQSTTLAFGPGGNASTAAAAAAASSPVAATNSTKGGRQP